MCSDWIHTEKKACGKKAREKWALLMNEALSYFTNYVLAVFMADKKLRACISINSYYAHWSEPGWDGALWHSAGTVPSFELWNVNVVIEYNS